MTIGKIKISHSFIRVKCVEVNAKVSDLTYFYEDIMQKKQVVFYNVT
jgi:hypothetical protein